MLRTRLLVASICCSILSGCFVDERAPLSQQPAPGDRAVSSVPEDARPATNVESSTPEVKQAIPVGNAAMHAKGLSILMPHHIGFAKVDCEQARQSPLIRHIADLLIKDSPGKDVLEPTTRMLAPIKVAWVAASPFESDDPDLETPWTGLGYTLYLQFSDEKACDEFLYGDDRDALKKNKHNGREYYEIPRDYAFFCYAVREGNDLFLSLTLDEVEHFLSSESIDSKSKLADSLKLVDLSQDVVVAGHFGELQQAAIDVVASMPDSYAGVKDVLIPLTKSLDIATLVLDFDGAKLADLRVDMLNGDSAEKMEEAIPGALAMAADVLDAQGEELTAFTNEEQVGTAIALSKRILEEVQVKRDGGQIELQLATGDKVAKLASLLLSPPPNGEAILNQRLPLLPLSQFAGATAEAGDPDAERHPLPPSASRAAGDPFVHYVEHVDTGKDIIRFWYPEKPGTDVMPVDYEVLQTSIVVDGKRVLVVDEVAAWLVVRVFFKEHCDDFYADRISAFSIKRLDGNKSHEVPYPKK